MEDFELFQEALEKERDQSYMSSMLSSMSMVLDEFYKSFALRRGLGCDW